MSYIHAIGLLSVTALIGLTAPTALAQERMRAGLWEMTTTKGGRTINNSTHCVTAEEARSTNGDAKTVRNMLEASFAEASCAVKDMAVTGKTISYFADCGSDATVTSVGDYRGDTVEIQVTFKGGASAGTMTTKGHRIGACP